MERGWWKVWRPLPPFLPRGDRLTTGAGNDGQQVRIILVPRFDKTGEIVVVDLESLEPELVRFSVEQ